MALTQEDLAQKIRAAGGTPDTNVRTIQRWEAGATTAPQPVHARALQMVTGLPLERLGFPSSAERIVIEDGRGGHDLGIRRRRRDPGPRAAFADYNGIWLSEYEYFSSGRDDAYRGRHHVLLSHIGPNLSVHSMPASASVVTLILELDGTIATGTWVEQTQEDGYYRGAQYHGAIQMLADPTGRRFTGKWIGFGKDGDINTGPWSLTFLDPSTGRAALGRYDRAVAESVG